MRLVCSPARSKGRRLPSFFTSTVDLAAILWARALWAAVETLLRMQLPPSHGYLLSTGRLYHPDMIRKHES